MKRVYFLLAAILILLSTISTTCDDPQTVYEIAIVNESSENIYCITIKVTESDGIGPGWPYVINRGDTVHDFVSTNNSTKWDKTYYKFMFYKDSARSETNMLTGVCQCYNLLELKNMNWTVVYRDNETQSEKI